MRPSALGVYAVTLLAAVSAAGEDLATFLAAATAAARPSATLRADGTLVTSSPDGNVRDRLVIVQRPNGDTYLTLQQAGIRALLLADGKAFIVPGPGQARESFAADAAFDGSEFTREDLQPFVAARYISPIIVDRNATEVTVSLTPRPSQYTLQAVTFDAAKKVPVKVMSYKETVSNLLRMRRDRGLIAAGGTWLPTEVTMENFPLRVISTMTLTWKPVEDMPGLFDPAALDKPSTLTWPAP